VTKLDAILVVFGKILYDLTRCGFDQRVRTVDEMHDERRLAAARWTRHDRRERMSEWQHDVYSLAYSSTPRLYLY